MRAGRSRRGLPSRAPLFEVTSSPGGFALLIPDGEIVEFAGWGGREFDDRRQLRAVDAVGREAHFLPHHLRPLTDAAFAVFHEADDGWNEDLPL